VPIEHIRFIASLVWGASRRHRIRVLTGTNLQNKTSHSFLYYTKSNTHNELTSLGYKPTPVYNKTPSSHLVWLGLCPLRSQSHRVRVPTGAIKKKNYATCLSHTTHTHKHIKATRIIHSFKQQDPYTTILLFASLRSGFGLTPFYKTPNITPNERNPLFINQHSYTTKPLRVLLYTSANLAFTRYCFT